MASAQGTATVNFGATPVSEATIAVTGQATISGTSRVEGWIMGDATGDNNAAAHGALAFLCNVFAESVIAGTGFTLRVLMRDGSATGQFTLSWVWSD